MTGHRRIPWKIKFVHSPHVWIAPTMDLSLINEVKKKLTVLSSLCSDDMDIETIEVSRYSQPEGAD